MKIRNLYIILLLPIIAFSQQSPCGERPIKPTKPEMQSSKEFRNSMKRNGMKLRFSSQKNRIDGVFQIISSQSQEGFNLFKEAINKL